VTKTEIREKLGERTLLDVALSLHGCVTGAADAYPGDMREAADILEGALLAWSDGPSFSRDFDDAVKRVLSTAIVEYRAWLQNNEWAR
jgi:hypothetical protein